MIRSTRTSRGAGVLLVLAVLLAACGGNDTTSDATTTTPTANDAADTTADTTADPTADPTADDAGDNADEATTPTDDDAQPATEVSGTLRLAGQSAGDAAGNPELEAVIAGFNEVYPDVTVELETQPIGGSYGQVLRTQLQGGSGPDVFYVTPGAGGLASVFPLTEAGFTRDLSDQPWADDLVTENARNLYWLDGQLTSIPLNYVPVGAVYHTNLYEEFGVEVPATMDDLLAACDTAEAAGRTLFTLAGANPQNAGILAVNVAANYVLVDDPDWNQQRLADEVTFADTPGWADALQRIVDMNEAGCFPQGVEALDIPQAAPMMGTGQALTFAMPLGASVNLLNIDPDLQLGSYPLPAENAEDTVVFLSPSDAIAVNADSENPDAALAFAEFVAVGGGATIYADNTGNLSIEQFESGENFDPVVEGLADLIAQPDRVFPLIQLEWPNAQVYDELGTGVQGLLTGQLTVDEVLVSMDRAWDAGQ